MKIDNYIYVWFIAQEKNYGKLDGLIEINKILINYSNKKNLPILLETSNIEVLNLYKRAGFRIYKTKKSNGEILYFFTNKLITE
ncbi:hypothetical protein FDT66_00550 [Polaribacter aestuariivivens]|uniref:GNAT family N-acetyltransferase n=1 Tax=Polaribacter aestuariivivens TaxID=2304626 RepID=A0A5S3N9L0_9FLAO|nr:hypothetical protein [Polaribacter aestuariivivens]TMM31988.1 hypothetical protein FDT66_00550 [Polaribacter aestuariivivens]